MKLKPIHGGAFAGMILAGGLVGAVSAQTLAAETGLTEEQAIEIALMEFPGEVNEVELEREDGMLVYEIEILSADGLEMFGSFWIPSISQTGGCCWLTTKIAV